MCDRCSVSIDRRQFIHRAVVGGLTVVAGASVLPSMAHAVDGDAAAGKRSTMATPSSSPASSSSGPTRQTKFDSSRSVGPVSPSIVTRAEWGADETIRDSARVFAPIRKLIVHHSASPNEPSNPASVVREIYVNDVKHRGYQDIGYNFLVDHHGRIYEGRWARHYAAGQIHDGEDGNGNGVMGGHATSFNAGTCGVCLLGDFTTRQPTEAALASLVQLLAWKAGHHMIDPIGSDAFVPPYLRVRIFPNIVGHRTIGSTLCPGRGLNDLLPSIRSDVRQRIGRFPAVSVDLLHALRFTNGATYPRPAGR